MNHPIRSTTQHLSTYLRRDYLSVLLVNHFPKPADPRASQKMPSVTATLVEERAKFLNQKSQEGVDSETTHLEYFRSKFLYFPAYLKGIQISTYKQVEKLHARGEDLGLHLIDVYV